jgi:hypothetical protein
LSICAQAAKNETNSLNARRAKLDEPPASGNIAVASAYVAAVQKKKNPVIRKTNGVSPSARPATRPSA